MSPIVRAAQRIASGVDTLSATFARLLGRVLRETERRLPPLVQQAQQGSRTALVRAAQANATRQQLRTALKAAGYDVLAESAYGPSLDTLIRRVLSGRLAQRSGALAPDVLGRIRALQLLGETDLLEEGDDVAKALYQSLVRGVFASRTHAQILRDLGQVLDRSEAHLHTLYDTSVSIFSRQVEVLQASDAPSTLFAYLGPIDEKTRPFCLTHLGRVYTRAEIGRLDNGQLGNVLLTAGGFNCRHVFSEISIFSELAELHRTRRRVPEVQEALDDLREREAA